MIVLIIVNDFLGFFSVLDIMGSPPAAFDQCPDDSLRDFWEVSPKFRSILKSEMWLKNLKELKFPFVCMHNGYCRIFLQQAQLDFHLAKKPGKKQPKLRTFGDNDGVI